jgi:hypothetical protein
MPSFRDAEGRAWLLQVNVSAVKKVKALVGVDLYAVVADGPKALGELLTDIVKVIDVVYVLCKDEADARGVTDEAFGRAMHCDALEAAAGALVEGLIDFFPGPRARAALRKVVAAGRRVQELKAEWGEKAVAEIDVEALAREEFQRALERAGVRAASPAPTSNGSSTSAPASPASTPAPSPSANSP